MAAKHRNGRGTKTPGAKSNTGGKDHKDQPASRHFGEMFARFAQAISYLAGRPSAFLLAVFVIIVWVASGPVFGYSDTWQLIINTGTTIITFLMVFLIQNSQNRDTLALQVKLSELILAMQSAEDRFAMIETLPDSELEDLHEECKQRAEHVLSTLSARRSVKAAAKRRSATATANGAKNGAEKSDCK